MSYHNDPYRVDYLKIYPCLKERPDVLEVLKKSDRKMRYMEVDLKSEQRRKNAENGAESYVPSKEDSLERLVYSAKCQFADDAEGVEDAVIKKDDLCRLRAALDQLSEEERALIHALFFDERSERELEEMMGVHRMTLHNKAWRAGGIHYILTNERYIGDSLWQKTYTTEAIPAVRHRNTGAREQYYVEGTHPPIISKEVFTKVQILIQMRKENYGKSPSETIHPLSRKAICGCCGTVLRRKPQRGKYYWCCMRHDTNREECPLMPISETSLCESFCRLYYKLKHQSIPILEQMLTNLQMIRNRRMLWSPDIVALNKRISDLSSQNQTLAFLKQQGLVDPDIFIAKTNELTKQLRQVKLEKEKLMDAESDMTALQTRDLIDLLEGGPEFLDSFDAELFGELVEKIIIESNDSVRFCLKNGLELRESIERTVR